MTGGLSIQVSVDTTAPHRGRLGKLQVATRDRRGFMREAGLAVQTLLRGHFAQRESEPNRTGFPKAHFWNRRIRANTLLTEVTELTAVIDIAAPEFRQKLYGGTITPKRAKYLAIPARSEAANKSPRSFFGLRFVPTATGGMLVADSRQQGPLPRGIKRPGSKSDGIVYYFLVKSVTQLADPRALPSQGAILAAAQEGGLAFLNREGRN